MRGEGKSRADVQSYDTLWGACFWCEMSCPFCVKKGKSSTEFKLQTDRLVGHARTSHNSFQQQHNNKEEEANMTARLTKEYAALSKPHDWCSVSLINDSILAWRCTVIGPVCRLLFTRQLTPSIRPRNAIS